MEGLQPRSGRLQSMLQAAVQSVQWTYSLFWQLCPQQGVLAWADGYYNGAIKTRKTVQATEVTAEEAMLQRSQQLRELYETLLAGETNQPLAKRACAALSPEDLTESEWFYLMCVSFSFPPGSGLPGKAYARRQHVWLTGANEVDSKTFSRAILAKSAKIQTVVCIPLLDGIVELGSTDKVHEDLGFIYHIKSFFTDDQNLGLPPLSKPALSEHSTSNPSSFRSSSLPPNVTYTEPLVNVVDQDYDCDMNADDDAEEEEEEEEETGRLEDCGAAVAVSGGGGAAEPSELMQLDMSEDIRLGSPDDASNNLDSDFHMLAVSQSMNADVCGPIGGAESCRRWQGLPDQLNDTSLQPPHTLELPIATEEEDSIYSQTVSTILQAQPTRWADSSSNSAHLIHATTQSSFAKWTNQDARLDFHTQHVENGGPQWVLKYILFTVPFLQTKLHGETSSPKSRKRDAAEATLPRTTAEVAAAQDEFSANHVVAERRRREKLNERFVMLRSLVPFVTKMDKVSILGDTIEYVKQLRKKIQDLEARNRWIEIERQQQKRIRPSSSRKMRISEADGGGGGGAKAKISEALQTEDVTAEAALVVEVSIIESDALLEMRCENREGLLLDVLQVLAELRIEATAVQTAVNGGNFVAEIRAKVKDNFKGKKASIMEVKRAIHHIIP